MTLGGQALLTASQIKAVKPPSLLVTPCVVRWFEWTRPPPFAGEPDAAPPPAMRARPGVAPEAHTTAPPLQKNTKPPARHGNEQTKRTERQHPKGRGRMHAIPRGVKTALTSTTCQMLWTQTVGMLQAAQ
eukprot:CAMPEP_0174366402 /NCGR_PEP_ID=MMETSP0811_2-20130205/81071_1 /TAXON_ID=73025 ORGANISM="Eutreptiella gymnastica-like, Strain CCMP1594" /NCGR_SAMPLE_ID=MMETSP0811_2 /ASSEMBLY_ACC=CAM_ASM_000667 /LENGTH=129 /DNA_ID=CAMNT_0015507921 /DNA_START=214 /DNA_END=603 /DNA_ORIENTATION=+